MDSETTSPTAPDLLATMLQNATIDKAERSEFSSTAHDTIKVTVNNYNFPKDGENHESSDIIDFLRNTIPPFLAEVRKNNQSQFTVDDLTSGADGSDSPVSSRAVTTLEGNPVDVIDIVPQEPSSFPVASVADRYTRSLLKCLAGYALYDPRPLSELSIEYLHHGVNVGDVGFVRGDGVFDFLFNVCPSKNGLINPPKLPDGFCLESVEHSATRAASPLPRKIRLFQSPITRTKSGEYICEGSEGAILELPEGAIQEEAMNIRPFAKLAARHGVQWYEYTMTRGREISNGSLYLITSFTKCAQWGIAVFDRKCARGEGLRFDKKTSLPFGKSTTKYHWKGSHTFLTKVADIKQGNAPNQCVFLRGYKIMIRQDIFNNLCNDQPRGSDPAIPAPPSRAESISLTRQRATRIRGGGGSDPMSKRLTDGNLLSSIMSSMTKSGEVVLHANFNSSLVHPSDLINAALLNQDPGAKVALTHDNVWCDLLRDNFPKFNCATLINIAKSYIKRVDEYGCVSLQKITDSRNFLEESSHLLQGTQAPGLQGSLTTPNEDFTPTLAKISPTLPRELIERIFLLLDTKSMLVCRLVNREFNEILQSSMMLYSLACKAAGVIDNPRSPLSYAERLDALLKREDAWRKLKPVFEMEIPSPGWVFGVAGGAYFLKDWNRKDLHYCHLSSSFQDDLQLIRIPGHGPGEDRHGDPLTFAISVYEHDLMVNLISSDIGNEAGMQRHSLDFVLLKFSTGEYHPLARHPQIHVQRSPKARPFVISKIAGDNLALIVNSDDTSFDKLFVFDWKTGHKRLQHETTKSAYSGLVFVSLELLLVTNVILSHFEVWKLPPSHPDSDPPVQILSLKIPGISPDYSTLTLKCDGDPSPFLYSIPYFPPRPFPSSPENSIIIVKLGLHPRLSTRIRDVSYTLIINRRALFDTIQTLASASFLEQQEGLPTWLANEITVHNIADADEPSVRLVAQSKLVSTVPHSRSSVASRVFTTSRTSTVRVSTDSFSSSIPPGSFTISSTSRYNFLQVKWANWGPPISRWFELNRPQAQWIADCTGQRYVFTVPGESMIGVADFNPHNFRRNAEMMAHLRREDKSSISNGKNEGGKGKGKEEWEILDHQGVFSEEVYMGLKCVVYHMPDNYDFDVVLMDEERLLGLNFDRLGTKVKVLYIG